MENCSINEVKVEIKNMKTNESKMLNGFEILGETYIEDGEGIYVIGFGPGYYFISLVYYTKGVKKICCGHRWSLEDNVFECDYNNLFWVCCFYGMNLFLDNFNEEDWIIPPYTKEYDPIEIQIKIERTFVPEKWEFYHEQEKKILEKIIGYGYEDNVEHEVFGRLNHLEKCLGHNTDDFKKNLAIKGKVTYSYDEKH